MSVLRETPAPTDPSLAANPGTEAASLRGHTLDRLVLVTRAQSRVQRYGAQVPGESRTPLPRGS